MWLWNLPKKITLFLIQLYQKTLSPDHGWSKHKHPYGFCPFTPSCSEYGRQAVQTYGFIKGGLKAGCRIFRCHPWTKGGVDKLI